MPEASTKPIAYEESPVQVGNGDGSEESYYDEEVDEATENEAGGVEVMREEEEEVIADYV